MSCGNKDGDFKGNSCVCEVVRAIKDIQDNAEEVCECPSNCFLEPLGAISPSSTRRHKRPDTRVIVLKTADGTPFHAFITNNNEHGKKGCVSIFFRVEDVFDNCCAILRVLEPIKVYGNTQNQQDNQLLNDQSVNLIKDCHIDLCSVCDVDFFRSTNDCITVDLKCFCAVQCIADVDLDICS